MQKGRRRTEDVEPGTRIECIRQMLSGPARLGLGLGVAAVREGADAEPCEWREVHRVAHTDLVVSKAEIVVRGRVPHCIVLRRVGLQNHTCRLVAATGAPGHLGQQGKGVLPAAVVREMQRRVGIDDADEADVPEVPALGDHLRADEAVCLVLAEAIVDLEVRIA